ncbi:MAG: hypothetical protein ACOY46_09785 [Bacillota bacterium]
MKRKVNKLLSLILITLICLWLFEGLAFSGTTTTLYNQTPTGLNFGTYIGHSDSWQQIGYFSAPMGSKIVTLGIPTLYFQDGVGDNHTGTVSLQVKDENNIVYAESTITLSGTRNWYWISLPNVSSNSQTLYLLVKNKAYAYYWWWDNPYVPLSLTYYNTGSCWNSFTVDLVDRSTADAAYYSKEASTNAVNAYNAANNASTVATSAYNAVTNISGNTIDAVRDASGTALSEARRAREAAESVASEVYDLGTAVTNIQNNMGADISPPIVRLSTLSGARATSGVSVNAIVSVSDNISSLFTYSLDGINYQPLPANRMITLPVNMPGSNLINVWVKDERGNVASEFIVIRRL